MEQKYDKIVISPYSDKWPATFEAIRGILSSELQGLYCDIQHVGSTSVPHLAAKPILDIDIIIDSPASLPPLIKQLHALGYRHLGTRGISGREAFDAASASVPRSADGREWMAHNLYVCIKGCLALENHIRFRDYLRENPEVAASYAALKAKIATEPACTLESYAAAKTSFIASVLSKTGIGPEAIATIRGENKLRI